MPDYVGSHHWWKILHRRPQTTRVLTSQHDAFLVQGSPITPPDSTIKTRLH